MEENVYRVSEKNLSLVACRRLPTFACHANAPSGAKLMRVFFENSGFFFVFSSKLGRVLKKRCGCSKGSRLEGETGFFMKTGRGKF